MYNENLIIMTLLALDTQLYRVGYLCSKAVSDEDKPSAKESCRSIETNNPVRDDEVDGGLKQNQR